MKKFAGFKKILLTGILLILLLLVCVGFLFFPILKTEFELLRGNLESKSYLDVGISGDKVNLDFQLSKKDEKQAKIFFGNFGGDVRKISLELDQKSIEGISKILPAKLTLSIKGNKLIFKNHQTVLLKSFIKEQRYEMATGSAKGVLKINNDRDFSLDIDYPMELAAFATSSGKINISKNSRQVFPILAKIGKIYLRVNGKNIEGEIELKKN